MWFNVARKTFPDINPTKFGDDLLKWWDALQPPARKSESSRDPASIPFDQWDSIRVQGKNGFYLVLMGLLWWGLEIAKNGSAAPVSIAEWKHLVDDARSVLEHWANNTSDPSASNKRKSADQTAEPANKRSRR